jgi:hypothetical protein
VVDKATRHLDDPDKALRRPTLAAWFDLLGFERDLDVVNWIGEAPATPRAFLRGAGLHHAAIDAMDYAHEIVQMNDAVVLGRQLTVDDDASYVLSMFFAKCNQFFDLCTRVDSKVGGCGLRGVIARGVRLNLQANHGWYPHDAPRERPCLCSPRPINMNTAFAKAYAVESSHQLPRASCLYVEKDLLAERGVELAPSWTRGPQCEIERVGAFVEVRRTSA